MSSRFKEIQRLEGPISYRSLAKHIAERNARLRRNEKRTARRMRSSNGFDYESSGDIDGLERIEGVSVPPEWDTSTQELSDRLERERQGILSIREAAQLKDVRSQLIQEYKVAIGESE